MAALSVGSLLAGRYEITAPIATGGMGEVWRARDRVLDRTVAAKVLKTEFTGDPSFLARFRNEARHTASLSHPNIASVYDYGETEQEGQRLAFLVIEFVDGGEGFDPSTLAEGGEHSPLEDGRGLRLMQALVDRLDFRHEADGRHRVTLEKRLMPHPPLRLGDPV